MSRVIILSLSFFCHNHKNNEKSPIFEIILWKFLSQLFFGFNFFPRFVVDEFAKSIILRLWKKLFRYQIFCLTLWYSALIFHLKKPFQHCFCKTIGMQHTRIGLMHIIKNSEKINFMSHLTKKSYCGQYFKTSRVIFYLRDPFWQWNSASSAEP